MKEGLFNFFTCEEKPKHLSQAMQASFVLGREDLYLIQSFKMVPSMDREN